MHQGSVLSSILLALEVDVVTEFAREGALNQLLCIEDLVLMSETIEGLRDKFLNWKEAFDSRGLNVNLGKSKVIASRGITHDGMSNI